jgi:hypothetical protein
MMNFELVLFQERSSSRIYFYLDPMVSVGSKFIKLNKEDCYNAERCNKAN